MKVGFIGLGLMGSRMAGRLQGDQITLSIYNRSKGVYDAFGDQVGKHETAAQCARDCDVVFTMLSTPEVVEEVALGQDGFLQSMRHGTVWVDCSTISPSFARLSGSHAAQLGLEYVEAPVAGSTGAASAGQLVFLVGGEKSVIDRVMPLLNLMGKQVLSTGAIGSGSAVKLLINYALGSAMMNYAEIIHAGSRMGLSRDFLFDQLLQFPVMAPFLKLKASKLKNDDYSPEFPLEWMVKDINLLGHELSELGLRLPMLDSLLSGFMKGAGQGQSREDFSSVVKTVL